LQQQQINNAAFRQVAPPRGQAGEEIDMQHGGQ